jgi:hypothetical protein
MPHQSRNALLACAVLCLVFLPAIAAHRDPGTHPLPFASTGLAFPSSDPHLEASDPAQGSGEDRVAGWYAGSALAWVQAAPNAPANGGTALCDFEVAGIVPLDEGVVDGVATGGSAPDGVWNDGGIGMACHTQSGFYLDEDYNSPGCDQYANARAEDAVVGADVWIVTACDATTSLVDDSLLSYALYGASCTVGEALAGDQDEAIGCAATFVDCMTGIDVGMGSCIVIDGTFCGADGVADSFVAGKGGGHAGPGVPFPSAGVDWAGNLCNEWAAASVLVYDAVVARFDPDGTVTLEDSSVATHGWIA